ncbi:TetR/AcrR family transcriptional regulator [Granulicella mallensis]|jgi:TetR/AcrR family transcriptional repressor of nem operon|uniref:TetR/AcrR family transcriptional repressor of nem operon n=1 Tax=Granulicella mallensis TaxID=940614 RepID=A0A7W7ZLV7_9BACT|nr:TetR/AcrR family transcriptional regulator [Granulicella mallensis]MBB5062317.1 TetR/AcrR family transcriptional repressor of nem operon [Granulicella mallensis]
MSTNAREDILSAAKLVAQAHGYAGLNFRDLAQQVGIKAASVYYHFPGKAELATAVAKRYWEDSAAYLESLLQSSSGPLEALRRYPETFRWALENDNRICLCSFMSAQFDDLPDLVKTEVQVFADVNIAWLKKVLIAAKVASPKEAEKRARAIYSGIVGAQLMARSRADIALYDSLIESYRTAGLLPA